MPQEILSSKINFTIIMLTQGNEYYLQRSLAAIGQQLNNSWELLIYSDVNLDRNKVSKWINRTCDINNNIHLYLIGDRNIPECLNDALMYSQGDYITFIRDCDVWTAIHLEALYQNLKMYKQCDFFITSASKMVEDDSINYYMPKEIRLHGSHNSYYMAKVDFLNRNIPYLSQLLIKRSVVNSGITFDIEFSEFFVENFLMKNFSNSSIKIINSFSCYIYIKPNDFMINSCGYCSLSEYLAEEVRIKQYFEYDKHIVDLLYTITNELVNCRSQIDNLKNEIATTVSKHSIAVVGSPARNGFELLLNVKKSSYFDAAWYKKTYSIKFVPALFHYYFIGWKRGYNPSMKFNTNKYLEKHCDVKEAKINPLFHYIQCGLYEGRNI